MMKNVAAAPSSARTSSSCGVAVGFGPSSNVRYTVGESGSVGMLQSTGAGAMASSRNGKGATCPSDIRPNPAAISSQNIVSS